MPNLLALPILLFLSGQQAYSLESLCAPLGQALKERIGQLDQVELAVQSITAQMTALEGECRSSSLSVSKGVAETTEGLSCKAQGDAQLLNAKLRAVFQSCVDRYRNVQVRVEHIATLLSPLAEDVDGGYQVVKANPEQMMTLCPKESKAVVRLNDSFISISAWVTTTQGGAKTGVQSYTQRLQETQRLWALTGKQNANCAQGDSGAKIAASPLLGKGSAPGIPQGMSREDPSTVTGRVGAGLLESGTTTQIPELMGKLERFAPDKQGQSAPPSGGGTDAPLDPPAASTIVDAWKAAAGDPGPGSVGAVLWKETSSGATGQEFVPVAQPGPALAQEGDARATPAEIRETPTGEAPNQEEGVSPGPAEPVLTELQSELPVAPSEVNLFVRIREVYRSREGELRGGDPEALVADLP